MDLRMGVAAVDAKDSSFLSRSQRAVGIVVNSMDTQETGLISLDLNGRFDLNTGVLNEMAV
jgi:hypothetical protein